MSNLTHHEEPEVRHVKFGYLRDLPDQRDYIFTVSVPQPTPPSVDLRPKMPPVYDQGSLGSCVANAMAGLCQYNEMLHPVPNFHGVPSRLFMYYNNRRVIRATEYDSGSSMRDAIKAVAYWGYCPENDWPYQIKEFAKRPSDEAYTIAKKEVVKTYRRVNQILNDMRVCISEGHPVLIGFACYSSFMSRQLAQSGVLNLPTLAEKALGGHAVLVVGYDDSVNRFIVRNSWGPKWGQQGYFTMPYEYVMRPDLCGDMWTIDSN